MAVVEELIRTEETGGLSFGNYELGAKQKKADFEFGGNLYKIKTYREITRLEKNDTFLYESVPGTTVCGFRTDADGLRFSVFGYESAQITLGLADDAEYDLVIGGKDAGVFKTSMGGKLAFSLELEEGKETTVEVKIK